MKKNCYFKFLSIIGIFLFSVEAFALGEKPKVTDKVKYTKCQDENYHYKESQDELGNDVCKNSCQCDGLRSCSIWGYCLGIPRDLKLVAPPIPTITSSIRGETDMASIAVTIEFS